MIGRVISAGKRAVGLYSPRRELKPFPDDVFLVSFPKSGNTWARFLIANLMHPERPVDFANLYKFIPDPFGTPKRVFDSIPRPRVIKSHECFDARYPRVIYIVRDPRDVVISQYHYHRKCRKITDDYPIEEFVSRFVAGQTFPNGSWGENVATWLVSRYNDPRFLLLRYEDMVADVQAELAKVASFLNIPATPQLLSQAAERSSANSMRKLEKAQSHITKLTKDSRKDLLFVRAAGSGGWRSSLAPELVRQIEDAWSIHMRFLGYELSSEPVSQPAKAQALESLLNSGPR
jgi:hypothetical protein